MRGALLLGACLLATGIPAVEVEPWGTVIDRAKTDPALAGLREAIVADARQILGHGIVKRKYTLADFDDPEERPRGITDPTVREIFLLSMSDQGANAGAARQLRRCATAWRLTGERAFLERVHAQLAEVATWDPLHRGGWNCLRNDAKYPKDWRTNPWWGGSWLGTGLGVRGLADTLEILRPEDLPDELRAKVVHILERTIAQVVDDWKTRRQWFVRGEVAGSNQWSLPTEALVRACLAVGRDRHAKAYELGVANVMKTLAAQNPDGSYSEGWTYTGWTIPAVLSAGRAMALVGDRRVLDHPFVKKFPTWFAHNLQPGGGWVQYFDCINAVRGTYGKQADFVATLVAATDDPVARWLLAYQMGGPTADLNGLVAATRPVPPRAEAPPAFARYEGASCLFWRSSWDDDADGLWLRGGHQHDKHDHPDRGHVSFTSKGRPILIECGTPHYSYPWINSHFKQAGHNVLHLGDEPLATDPKQGIDNRYHLQGSQGKKVIAPITVARLDQTGGEAAVTLTKGYPDLKRWQRQIAWSGAKLVVTDTVELTKPQVVLFRWHLGTRGQATLVDGTATWADATLAVAADAPLTLRQTRREDHYLSPWQGKGSGTTYGTHPCILVRSAGPVLQVVITTTVTPVEPAGAAP